MAWIGFSEPPKKGTMKVYMIFLPVFLIFIGGSGAPESRACFDFPPNADPLRVGKLITENLLSRDYMLRADETGIHLRGNYYSLWGI